MSAQSTAIRATTTQSAQADSSVSWLALDFSERLFALLCLLSLAPVLLVLCIVVRRISGMSPFVAHRRIGRYGRPFWVLKLRTMWPRISARERRPRWVEYIVDEQGPYRKSANDPRVTHWFARFCRRFSLDELPQLVHVVAGRMSLIGPRPLTRTELSLHYGSRAREVLQVKPGLTGLWQVMGRDRLSYRQRARLDVFYVRRLSAALYIMIAVRTIPEVLFGRNAC